MLGRKNHMFRRYEGGTRLIAAMPRLARAFDIPSWSQAILGYLSNFVWTVVVRLSMLTARGAFRRAVAQSGHVPTAPLQVDGPRRGCAADARSSICQPDLQRRRWAAFRDASAAAPGRAGRRVIPVGPLRPAQPALALPAGTADG